MPNILETSRTCLRQLKADDADALLALYGDAAIMAHSVYGVQSATQISDLIKKQNHYYEKYGFGLWIVLDKDTQQLLGCCGLEPKYLGDETLISVAYRFHASAWGKGLATEVVNAVIKHGTQQLHLDAIHALIQPDNHSSQRVAEKAGLSRFKTTQYRGYDVNVYRIVTSDI